MRFDGKRVLITGSTRGIGWVTAREFLARGASVAINGRDPGKVHTAAEKFGEGASVIEAPGDLASVDHCESVVSRAIDGLGGLDILVNNAGYYTLASVEESNEDVWDMTMNVNVKSMFFCTRAALSALRDGGGVIVNHASNAGLQGFAGCVLYSAAKGAVVNLTRALAMELAPDIRVNCLCPSTLDNEMGWREFNLDDDPQAAYQACIDAAPLKRIGTSEDAAGAIMFLASDYSKFITGIAIPVDGGKAAGRSGK